MHVTDSGITTVVNDLHPSNALSQIVVTVDGIVIVVNSKQFLKQNLGILYPKFGNKSLTISMFPFLEAQCNAEILKNKQNKFYYYNSLKFYKKIFFEIL